MLPSIYKVGGPSIKLPLISWFLIMLFNFGYVYIISCGLNGCIYIVKNSSCDNLTNSFTIPEMYGRKCLVTKGINIVLASLIIYSTTSSTPPTVVKKTVL